MLYQPPGAGHLVPPIKFVICAHCGEYSVWHEKDLKMLYPDATGVQPPNSDMNKDIQDDYLEAASILQRSPRGAAALVRLCIQKLCKQLGESGDNINNDIKNLVAKGLPPEIQKSLDIVRVIGNNAVHPGQIDLKDDMVTAAKLFELVNIITYDRITRPKELEELYDALPKSSKNAIDKRDKGGTK
jgi:hypothetical protein